MASLPTQLLQRVWMVRFAILAALGAVAGLGQAPTDMWYATIVATAAAFLLFPKTGPARSAAFHMWAFGFGYFAISLRWIVEPFLVDIARHGWMAPFALVLMASGAALFWGLSGWLTVRLARGHLSPLAVFLVGAEVLRALILTGFPWALIGHIWMPTGLAQLAAFGGPHLLSLITVTAVLATVGLVGAQRVLGLVTLGLLIAVSFVLQPKDQIALSDELPLVRMVQPNVPQEQKWDPAFRNMFYNRLLRMTAEGDAPDMVVWPETAIPYLLSQIEGDMSLLSDAARGAPLVFGIQRRDADLRAFNSLAVMGAGGELLSVYDKRHLVPFGEYMPGARLLGQIGATGLAQNLGVGFTPGEIEGPLAIPGIGGAVPLICYEGIFAEEIHSSGERPRMLLLITNDAWFGKAAGPFQHLAQARLRAIEHGLPMVRVANTGITAMIDAKGRITASLGLDIEGAIDTRLPPAAAPTAYSRFGEWPVMCLLVLLTIMSILWRRPVND